MLVLTRKPGQRLMIGSNIVLTVVSVRGDRVRLGFRAPPDVAIHREEVFDRIQHEDFEFEIELGAETEVSEPASGVHASAGI